MTLDPVASLMLDEAGDLAGSVLVIDDSEGALTRAALEAGASVRAYCDDIRDAAALPADTSLETLDGVDVNLVLWRLPKSLAGLESYAEVLAAGASEGLRVVAGGRVKHMTLSQNEALARSFREVRASRGRQKSRVLHTSGPIAGTPRWPQRRYEPDADLMVVAWGQVFNTNRLDLGTRLLLQTLRRDLTVDAPRALDLGCGSGILATWLARGGYEVTASDVSRAAVASTALTAEANGVSVATRLAVGLEGWDAASLDVIVTNPPFHRGTMKDSTPTLDMFAQAGTVLAPGGELWAVWNAHLPYLDALRRHVGRTQIMARDRHFIVTRSFAG